MHTVQAWPKGLAPLRGPELDALSTPEGLRLLLALFESPLDAAHAASVTGLPEPEALDVARELVRAGLAEEDEGVFRPAVRHLRDAGEMLRSRFAFRTAVLDVAASTVEEGRRALAEWGDAAKAGIGIVTLPDDPDVLREAAGVLAEAEDKLRLVAARHSRWAAPRLRVMVLITSADEPLP